MAADMVITHQLAFIGNCIFNPRSANTVWQERNYPLTVMRGWCVYLYFQITLLTVGWRNANSNLFPPAGGVLFWNLRYRVRFGTNFGTWFNPILFSVRSSIRYLFRYRVQPNTIFGTEFDSVLYFGYRFRSAIISGTGLNSVLFSVLSSIEYYFP